MQRSSSIKSVSNPKNDFTIQKAIKRILIESVIEGNEDDQSSNQRNLPNYGDWYRNRPQFSSHRISRRETPKEATEEDDNQREFSYVSTTNLEQFDDKDYPYLSKKIHEVNKSFQKSKQGNGNTNENEKNNKLENNNEQEKGNEQIQENKNKNSNIIDHVKPFQNVPAQSYSNEGENALLGALIENKTGILSVDIGTPIIGMNSIRELGSFNDIKYEFDILLELFTNFSKYSIHF